MKPIIFPGKLNCSYNTYPSYTQSKFKADAEPVGATENK